MIHEFAIDPGLVASWHDRIAYRFFDGKFGPGTKRVLCRYPAKRWRRLIFDAFRQTFQGDPAARQSAKKRLDVLVRHLECGSTQRNHSWKQDGEWLACAVDEHRRRSFQGILVLEAPDAEEIPDYVLEASVVSEDDPQWNPPVRSTPREASELLTDLGPLLRHARRVRLVDPYFDGRAERWMLPMLQLLELAQADRESDESVRIELYTSVDREFGIGRMQDPESERCEGNALIDSIAESVRSRLNGGTEILVCVWSCRSYATLEKLHNRWILSETGGIQFGHGLDTPGSGTDDLTLLSKSQWEHRWSMYSDTSSVFREVCREVISPVSP